MRSIPLVLPAALLLTLSGQALAQRYIGQEGTALDRNQRVGGTGINPRGRDVAAQIWANNNIITGNAPAGRSFRGYVGYRAPNEFRGVAGSDTNYAFRRDATSSAQVQTGIRASDALRYQLDLTTGQSVPRYLSRTAAPLFEHRESNAASAATVAPPNAALRSTGEYLAARALRPTLVGSRTDEQGNEWNATASPLLGLTWLRLSPNTLDSPLQATPTDGGNPAVTPPPLPGSSVTPGAPPIPDTPELRAERSRAAALDRMSMTPTGLEARALGMGRARGPAEVPNAAGRAVDTQVVSTGPANRAVVHNQIIDVLRGAYGSAAAHTDPASPGSPDAAPGTPRHAVELELDRVSRVMRGLSPLAPPAKPADGSAPATTAAADPAPDPDSKLPPELVKALRSAGIASIDSMVPDAGANTDPATYRSQMAWAQDLLAKGQYFDSEDRFTRAMAAMPTDPLARLGRVHAQLGAGLFLSASTNLRSVLKDHPEIVGAKFDSKLIPSPERSAEVAALLRSDIEKGGSGTRPSTSLLLAYLGHITADAAMTAEGLEAMQRHPAADDASERTFLELLRAVWTTAPER